MRILNTTKERTKIEFGHLSMGDWFTLHKAEEYGEKVSDIFVKVNEYKGECNTVSVTTGETYRFHDMDDIEIFNSSVAIHLFDDKKHDGRVNYRDDIERLRNIIND
jgi:hypothetical protein